MAPTSTDVQFELNRRDMIQHFSPLIEPKSLINRRYVSSSTFFLRANEGAVIVICLNDIALHSDGLNTCKLKCPYGPCCSTEEKNSLHANCEDSVYGYYVINRSANTRIVVAGTDMICFFTHPNWDVCHLKFNKAEFFTKVTGMVRHVC
jgi:hypothetical protein